MNNYTNSQKPFAITGLLAKGPARQRGDWPPSVQAFVTQIQKLNSDWRAGLAEMQKRDVEFAFRLASAGTPSDAMQVCTEWMSGRVGSVQDMQKQFFDLWGRYASNLPAEDHPATKPQHDKAEDKGTTPTSGTTDHNPSIDGQ